MLKIFEKPQTIFCAETVTKEWLEMIKLYYNAYSVADFIRCQELKSNKQRTDKQRTDFLETLFTEEQAFLRPDYRGNKKKFLSETLNWVHYFENKGQLGIEFPATANDFNYPGSSFSNDGVVSEYETIDSYFMSMRLEILFCGSQNFVRRKLRTLLKDYGYKRRTSLLMEHVRDCMMFYHIQPYIKDGEECDIREIDLDQMIIFRVL